MTGLGIPQREAEEMDYPVVIDLFKYWNESNPPTHEVAAAYAGFKPKRRGTTKKATKDDIQKLIESVGGTQSKVPPRPPPRKKE